MQEEIKELKNKIANLEKDIKELKQIKQKEIKEEKEKNIFYFIIVNILNLNN